MRTLHFVYAVPHGRSRVEHVGDIVRRYTQRIRGNRDPRWRNGRITTHESVVATPFAITVNVLKHLQTSYRVKLYDWREPGCVPLEGDDILVGLPCNDERSIVRNTLEYKQGVGTKVLLMPYSHGIVEMQEWVTPYYALADAIGAITGQYWFDTVGASIFAPFKEKMVHIDLGVDAAQFPRVKRSFNAPGQRGFLFIGHSQHTFPYKGVHLLSELAGLIPDMRFGWIGSGPDIPNVAHVSPFRELTPAFMAEVTKDYDFLVTMGISDANPTTILEAMAWGLPVICTPQSGYYRMPSIINVSIDDMALNVATLREWQYAPDDRLRSIADTNRTLVETQFTWDNFNRHLDEAIALGIRRRARDS